MPESITLASPDDFHVHLRQGPELRNFARDCATSFGRALVMPNTTPALTTPEQILDYKSEILSAARDIDPGFEALMTFKILGNCDLDVKALKDAGAVAGKLYPQGVTTHSEDGVRDVESLFPVFSEMEKAGLLLLVHGEHPESFCLDRERAFLPQLDKIVRAFPDLRMVLEHVSTRDSVEWVKKQTGKVAATITVHHLMYTLDDMLGDKLRPHLFCKPLLKRSEDRESLQEVVLDSHPRFFFGSDSAPHPKVSKECDCGAAGVYSMPVALSLLAGFFDNHGRLESLAPFLTDFGSRFYGLAPNAKCVSRTLVRKPWKVPPLVHGVVPLCAGETLEWQLQNSNTGVESR